MIATQPPSIQREYSEFWPGDEAFIQPPEAPADDADDAAKKVHAEAIAQYERKIERARETGNWNEILVPGGQPTIFTLRPIPGQAQRTLAARVLSGEVDQVFTAPRIAFQAAIVKIENPSIEVKPEADREIVKAYGRIASVSVTDALDRINARIVSDLGELVFSRGTSYSPKY